MKVSTSQKPQNAKNTKQGNPKKRTLTQITTLMNYFSPSKRTMEECLNEGELRNPRPNSTNLSDELQNQDDIIPETPLTQIKDFPHLQHYLPGEELNNPQPNRTNLSDEPQNQDEIIPKTPLTQINDLPPPPLLLQHYLKEGELNNPRPNRTNLSDEPQNQDETIPKTSLIQKKSNPLLYNSSVVDSLFPNQLEFNHEKKELSTVKDKLTEGREKYSVNPNNGKEDSMQQLHRERYHISDSSQTNHKKKNRRRRCWKVRNNSANDKVSSLFLGDDEGFPSPEIRKRSFPSFSSVKMQQEPPPQQQNRKILSKRSAHEPPSQLFPEVNHDTAIANPKALSKVPLHTQGEQQLDQYQQQQEQLFQQQQPLLPQQQINNNNNQKLTQEGRNEIPDSEKFPPFILLQGARRALAIEKMDFSIYIDHLVEFVEANKIHFTNDADAEDYFKKCDRRRCWGFGHEWLRILKVLRGSNIPKMIRDKEGALKRFLIYHEREMAEGRPLLDLTKEEDFCKFGKFLKKKHPTDFECLRAFLMSQPKLLAYMRTIVTSETGFFPYKGASQNLALWLHGETQGGKTTLASIITSFLVVCKIQSSGEKFMNSCGESKIPNKAFYFNIFQLEELKNGKQRSGKGPEDLMDLLDSGVSLIKGLETSEWGVDNTRCSYHYPFLITSNSKPSEFFSSKNPSEKLFHEAALRRIIGIEIFPESLPDLSHNNRFGVSKTALAQFVWAFVYHSEIEATIMGISLQQKRQVSFYQEEEEEVVEVVEEDGNENIHPLTLQELSFPAGTKVSLLDRKRKEINNNSNNDQFDTSFSLAPVLPKNDDVVMDGRHHQQPPPMLTAVAAREGKNSRLEALFSATSSASCKTTTQQPAAVALREEEESKNKSLISRRNQPEQYHQETKRPKPTLPNIARDDDDDNKSLKIKKKRKANTPSNDWYFNNNNDGVSRNNDDDDSSHRRRLSSKGEKSIIGQLQLDALSSSNTNSSFKSKRSTMILSYLEEFLIDLSKTLYLRPESLATTLQLQAHKLLGRFTKWVTRYTSCTEAPPTPELFGRLVRRLKGIKATRHASGCFYIIDLVYWSKAQPEW